MSKRINFINYSTDTNKSYTNRLEEIIFNPYRSIKSGSFLEISRKVREYFELDLKKIANIHLGQFETKRGTPIPIHT